MILGEVLFSNDTVILETYDDGRLDRLVDRFTAAAGSNIPPAHPRTKIIGKEQRHLLALSWRWQIPEGLAEEDAERLNNEQIAHIIRDVWPETRHPALRWRTPLRAARAGDSETRSARPSSSSRKPRKDGSISSTGTSSARNSSSRPSPPSIPTAWTSTSFPCRDCREFPSTGSTMTGSWLFTAGLASGEFDACSNRVARLIDARPALMVKGKIEPTTLYGELALDAAGRSDRAAGDAAGSLAGVESEPPLKRSANALAWEMIELQVQMVLDGPEVWVPSLAVILERYRGNQEATSAVFLRLINLGLVQVVQDPNHPDQMALDTRTLEYYLNQYGPRVTTASGQLGVAATRGEIWTPESAAGGGGGSPIWTPGSAPPPAAGGGKPSIIVTGH